MLVPGLEEKEKPAEPLKEIREALYGLDVIPADEIHFNPNFSTSVKTSLKDLGALARHHKKPVFHIANESEPYPFHNQATGYSLYAIYLDGLWVTARVKLPEQQGAQV